MLNIFICLFIREGLNITFDTRLYLNTATFHDFCIPDEGL